jgi:hypothetical protein
MDVSLSTTTVWTWVESLPTVNSVDEREGVSIPTVNIVDEREGVSLPRVNSVDER